MLCNLSLELSNIRWCLEAGCVSGSSIVYSIFFLVESFSFFLIYTPHLMILSTIVSVLDQDVILMTILLTEVWILLVMTGNKWFCLKCFALFSAYMSFMFLGRRVVLSLVLIIIYSILAWDFISRSGPSLGWTWASNLRF